MRAPHLAQLGIQAGYIADGVCEHEARATGFVRGVTFPGRDQSMPGDLLVLGLGDRPGPVERRHGFGEPALGQVARRLARLVRALAGDLDDRCRAVALAQLGEQPAAPAGRDESSPTKRCHRTGLGRSRWHRSA
jgi:hypothetical protein